jgi:glutaredoxin
MREQTGLSQPKISPSRAIYPLLHTVMPVDSSALAELKKRGYMTTPVIVINGLVIGGFADKIDHALQD